MLWTGCSKIASLCRKKGKNWWCSLIMRKLTWCDGVFSAFLAYTIRYIFARSCSSRELAIQHKTLGLWQIGFPKPVVILGQKLTQEFVWYARTDWLYFDFSSIVCFLCRSDYGSKIVKGNGCTFKAETLSKCFCFPSENACSKRNAVDSCYLNVVYLKITAYLEVKIWSLF